MPGPARRQLLMARGPERKGRGSGCGVGFRARACGWPERKLTSFGLPSGSGP